MTSYFEMLDKVHILAFKHNLPVKKEDPTFLPSLDVAKDAQNLRRNLRKDFKSALTGKTGPRLTEYSARILEKAGFVFLPLMQK